GRGDVGAEVDVDLQLGLGAAWAEEGAAGGAEVEGDEGGCPEPEWSVACALPVVHDALHARAAERSWGDRCDAIDGCGDVGRASRTGSNDARLCADPEAVPAVERRQSLKQAHARYATARA